MGFHDSAAQEDSELMFLVARRDVVLHEKSRLRLLLLTEHQAFTQVAAQRRHRRLLGWLRTLKDRRDSGCVSTDHGSEPSFLFRNVRGFFLFRNFHLLVLTVNVDLHSSLGLFSLRDKWLLFLI